MCHCMQSLSQAISHWQDRRRFRIATFLQPLGLLFPALGNTGLDTHTAWQAVHRGDRCIRIWHEPVLVISAFYAIFCGFSAFCCFWTDFKLYSPTTVSTGKGIASSSNPTPKVSSHDSVTTSGVSWSYELPAKFQLSAVFWDSKAISGKSKFYWSLSLSLTSFHIAYCIFDPSVNPTL